jgi:uncharacterized membrane protein YhaH (DUF805 family)
MQVAFGYISREEDVMDWKYLFTSFEGRINRKPYWIGALVFLAVVIVLYLIIFALGGFSALIVGYIIIAILSIYPSLALMTKRFHDRGKSGWWALVFYIPTVINSVVSYTDPDSTITMITSVITLLVSIWILIELGFLKGKPGSNEYGPNPLEP